MMRISTWNVNGLRSGVSRGFEGWLSRSQSDVVCLQEVKTPPDLLTANWFPGYYAHWYASERPGYSGVVTLVKNELYASSVHMGIGDPLIDLEARVLTVEFPELNCVNVYAPHSHRQLKRLDFKIYFLERLNTFIELMMARGKPIVMAGDLNVAFDERDVANFGANRKNAGFLPQERGWLEDFLKLGFFDAFRHFHSDSGHYTWWSPIKGVRERNVGWRLDYILMSNVLRNALMECHHSPEEQASDHCPVTATLDYDRLRI